MERWNIPGMVVGVLRDGERAVQAWGTANIETGQLVRPDSLFRIASISKPFTATLTMQLVEEGRLSLDEPAATYLPDLRLQDEPAQRKVTIRHLLSHTSGFRGDSDWDFGMGDDALARSLPSFQTLRQHTAPGTMSEYNNNAYNLLGLIAERLLGKPYETLLQERVLSPLGLGQTTFFLHDVIVQPHAIGYWSGGPDGLGNRAASQYDSRNGNPCGGLWSTADDLLTFANFQMSRQEPSKPILSPTSIQAMREPQVEACSWPFDWWGLCWELREIDGVRPCGHGGSFAGFQSQLTFVPERGFAIVLLTNSGRGYAAIRATETWALDHYLGLRRTLPGQIHLADSDLNVLAGMYQYQMPDGLARTVEDETRYRVEVEDGGLVVRTVERDASGERAASAASVAYRPISKLEFMAFEGEDRGMRINFILGEDGTPRFLRLNGRLIDRAA
jgi:CubicO group peptidase (beta-lactamase class C family)